VNAPELGKRCLAAVRSQQWQQSPSAAWAALAVGECLAQEVEHAEPAAAAVLHTAVILALHAEAAAASQTKGQGGGAGHGALAGALTALGLLRLRLGWGLAAGADGSLAAAAESAPLLRAAVFLHGEDGGSHDEDRYASLRARKALTGLTTATWLQGDTSRAEALAEVNLLLAESLSQSDDQFYSVQLSVSESRAAAKVAWRAKAQLGVFLLSNPEERSAAAVWLSQAAVEAEAVLGLDAEEAVRLRGLQAVGWLLSRDFERSESWLQARDPQAAASAMAPVREHS
jgi:hypothetical protein